MRACFFWGLSVLLFVAGCSKDSPSLSNEKELLTMVFRQADNPKLSQDYSGQITGNTVQFNLPAGTDVSQLVATFTSSPKSVVLVAGASQTSGSTKNNFTLPLTYRVRAENGTGNDYGVTVVAPPLSSARELTAFGFQRAVNPLLPADFIAVVNGTAITIEIPAGTDRTALVASFAASPKAIVTVNKVVQESGKTPNNFSETLTYTVTAEDQSTKAFTVTVGYTGLAPNQAINLTTSYYRYTQDNLYLDLSQAVNNLDNYLARAYADFDKDGDLDIMAMFFNYISNSPIPVEYYKNNGGVFSSDGTAWADQPPGYVHGRKAITGDFDANGWTDVVIAGHGFDQPPFPGETAKIIFNFGGQFTSQVLPLPAGYHHSVCAGDVDHDGDTDLFLTNSSNIGKFLINDGKGQFTIDETIFPSSLGFKYYYTSELFDINHDGFLDLVNTGHEMDGAQSVVLWGNYTGKLSTDRMTVLPGVSGNGVAIDIDFIDYNKDGLEDIVLTRTGDNTGALTFYQGFYIQLLRNDGKTFTDVTGNMQKNADSGAPRWVNWLRVHDVDHDGDLDITSDDRHFGLEWINNNGQFSR